MITKIGRVVSVALLSAALVVSFAIAQEKKEKTDCEKRLKTNIDTETLVKNVIDEVEKAKPTGQAALDLQDAKDWYEKAEKKHAEVKLKVEKGECNEEIMKDLGWVWQWYVKSATMAVNAKLGLPSMKKGREVKK